MNLKTNIREKWWIHLIIALLLCLGVEIVAWAEQPPKYKLPKKIETYRIANENKSPDIVTAVFLKSIYKEDVSLLKKCVLNRFLQSYNTSFYNNNLDDKILKSLLHKVNQEFIDEYGNDWYNKVNVASVTIDENTGFAKIILEIDGKEFKYKVDTVKERQDSIISNTTFIQFLGPREILNAK